MDFKCIIFFAFLLSISIKTKAQDRPEFLPEDINLSTLNVKCFCKPGVLNKSRSRGLDLSFGHLLGEILEEEEGFPFQDQPSELKNVQDIKASLKIPVLNKEGLKLLVGYFFKSEKYNFDIINSDYETILNRLDNQFLKSTGLELLLSKSIDEKFYASFRYRRLSNGDFSGLMSFDEKYAIDNATLIFGIKKNEQEEWGIGLNYSSGFRNSALLPFLIYNKTFNDKWGLESAFPAVVLARYNISSEAILLGGVKFQSRSYAFETNDFFDYNMNHSELRFSVTLEKQIKDWMWFDITVGFQKNFSTDFEFPNDDTQNFQVELSDSPYFKVGFFLSPPDRFLK